MGVAGWGGRTGPDVSSFAECLYVDDDEFDLLRKNLKL